MALTHGVSLAAGVLGSDGFGLGLDNDTLDSLAVFNSVVLKSTQLYSTAGTPPPNVTTKVRYDMEGLTLNNVNLRSGGIWDVSDALTNLGHIDTTLVPSVPIDRVSNTTHNQSTALRRLWERNDVSKVELNLKYLDALNPRYPIDFRDIQTKLADTISAVNNEHFNMKRVWIKLPADRYTILRLTDYHEQLYNLIEGFVVSNSIDGKIYDNLVEKRTNVRNSVVGVSSTAMKYVNCHIIETMINNNGAIKPIIGCGGIASIEDIQDYEKAGAAGVQLGSLFYYYPETAMSLARIVNANAEAARATKREVVSD